MAQSSFGKSISSRFRRLTVESLQSRFVFTGALHTYLDAGPMGFRETLRDAAIGATGDIRILGDGFSAVWDFDDTGNLIKQQSLGELAGPGRGAVPLTVWPNGSWLAGPQRDSTFFYDAFSRWSVSEQGSLFPVEGIGSVVDAANTGELLLVGKDSHSWYRWNPALGLIALTPLEAASETYPTAISGDGSVIIGRSTVGNKMVPTIWDASGPHALPSSEQNMEAVSISDNGRVIGGYANSVDSAFRTAVVWTNGTLKQLADENGEPVKGIVDVVINAGNSDRWVAFGSDDNKSWIAFDDGVAYPFDHWLRDHYDIALNDLPHALNYSWNHMVMAAKADGNNLRIVVAERDVVAITASFPGTYIYGSTRPHLLVLPIDSNGNPIDEHPLDINNDGVVSPVDALIIINQLNEGNSGPLADRPQMTTAWPKIDTSGDGELSAHDVIYVINLLNRNPEQSLAKQLLNSNFPTSSPGEGESSRVVSDPSSSLVDIDSVFGELGSRTKRLRR